MTGAASVAPLRPSRTDLLIKGIGITTPDCCLYVAALSSPRNASATRTACRPLTIAGIGSTGSLATIVADRLGVIRIVNEPPCRCAAPLTYETKGSGRLVIQGSLRSMKHVCDRSHLIFRAAGGWTPGSREVLLLPRPLRTARDSFPSCSSSLHKRPSRDAAALVRCSCTWICRWQLAWNNSKLSVVSEPPWLRQIRWWIWPSSVAIASG